MTPKAVRDFILWLRKERISCTTLTIGNITIDGFVDGKREAPKVEKSEPRMSDWQARAEALLSKPSAPVDVVPDESKIE